MKGITPFICGYKITQPFGANPELYVPLKGHEGVDLVPIRACYGVHVVESGIVIEDIDDPQGRAYGNTVRIKTNTGRVWIYAHMSQNVVKKGDVLSKGQLVGIMGNTGRCIGSASGGTGVHLHLSVYNIDSSGNKLNPDNGFAGCFDPLSLEDLK